MILMEGKTVSRNILFGLKEKTTKLINEGKRVPGLAAILIGENPASQVYVNSKIKSCAEIGYYSQTFRFEHNVNTETVRDLIETLNSDSQFDGILLQLPLPKQLDEELLLGLISPSKDVDGFSAVNMGNLLLGRKGFLPCTPAGIIAMMEHYGIETSGKHCVVLGRSNIVGKPIAVMLMQKAKSANATVTVCHSATPNIKEFTLQADIIIAAIGIPNFLKVDMVKPGAVIIDVGINRIDDSALPKGYRITGDADFEALTDKVSAITPVPGGIGLTTIALLMANTFQAYEGL